MKYRTAIAASVMLLACTHSDAFITPGQAVGPFTSGADVQLTLNPDQDYWPTWTADGRGILYSFVDPGSTFLHRCMGLLPAAGGSRLWQWCDNRATQLDSSSSFTAYALSSSGALLYA